MSAIATNTGSVTTPAVAGGTNQLYLVSIANYQNVNVTGVSGLGLTWSEVKAQCSGRSTNGIEIWQAFGSPSSGAVTVTFAATTQATVLSVSRYSGADPANPTSGMTGENTLGPNGACSGGTTNNSPRLTLTALQNDTTLYTASSVRMRTVSVADSDYTQRANNLAGAVESRTRLYIQDHSLTLTGSDTLNQTLNDVTDWTTAGVVINPAPGTPPTPTPTPAATPEPTPPLIGGPVNPEEIPVRLLVIIYNQVLENYGGVKVSQYFNWNDPDVLTNQLVADSLVFTHGTVKYEVVERIERDEWPLHTNGQRYNDDLYVQETQAGNWTLGPGDYNAIINDNGIEQKVNEGKVDEVWLWSGPGLGWWESTMAGNGAYWINGTPVTGVNSKAFVIMGLNFERGLAEASESYGHRTENIINRVYNYSWNYHYEGGVGFVAHGPIVTDWDKFTALDRDFPDLGGVGFAHNAFNTGPGEGDYITTSPRYASTSANDWFNYPEMTDDRTTENCNAWGCTGYGFFQWWYGHMPYMGGVKGDILANWWRYIVNVDEYKGRNRFASYLPGATDFAEGNAADWSCAAEEATCTLTDETTTKKIGASSVKFATNGAFDTYVRYPGNGGANWNIFPKGSLYFMAYAQNENSPQFQGPIVVYLKDDQGNAFRYESPGEYMNRALNTWALFEIPLSGDATWTRTTIGTPTLTNIDQIEIHNDTWGSTFTIIFDGVGFTEDYTEGNAASWTCWAEGATCSLTNDAVAVISGDSSVRFDTDGGFDTFVAYPGSGGANWNLHGHALVFWANSVNPSPFDFQNSSPWIILKDSNGNYLRYQTDREVMNLSIGRWKKFRIPLTGDSMWKRTMSGTPSLSDIDQIEIHIDTWDNGFTTNIDGFHFEKLDTTVPTVTIDTPVEGSSVSGVVPVTMSASDNNVVNRVDLFVNDSYVGTDALTPYIIPWVSGDSGPGPHTLRARAVDFAGNETISAAVTVNPPLATPTPVPTPVVTPSPTPVPSPSPVGEIIFQDDFESGTTSAWSGETDTEADLNVTTIAALAGSSYGLEAFFDNNTVMYVTDTSPVAESRYLASFWFDPNSIRMVSGDTHNLLVGRTGSGQSVFTIQFNNNTGNNSGYRIRVQIYTDGGSAVNGTYYPISDMPHKIAVDWQSASVAGANNGAISLSIDDVLKQTKSAIDNDMRRVEDIRFGPSAGIDPGTLDTYYLDAFESRRSTGTPPSPSSSPTPQPTPSPSPGTSPVPSPSSSPSPTPSDVIFADGFESGNTSAWSAEVDGEADFNVTPGAALVGSQGLAALFDNNTSMYVRDDSPVAEPRYRARFYFDPNSIAMASSDVHTILQGRVGSTIVFNIQLNNNTGTTSGYQIRTQIYNDAGNTTNGTYIGITDAPHAIELDWQVATSAGANNGSITLWIDGVQRYISPGIDNDMIRVEEVRFGPLAGIDTGTRGTYYLDAFESRRTTYIGP